MSAKKQRRVPSGAGLSKQRVVAEAIRLADGEGVDGLSMRRLAGALGAGAMSLYHYVANKEELLDAMVDAVFEEIELPPDVADWQSHVAAHALHEEEVRACVTVTCATNVSSGNNVTDMRLSPHSETIGR